MNMDVLKRQLTRFSLCGTVFRFDSMVIFQFIYRIQLKIFESPTFNGKNKENFENKENIEEKLKCKYEQIFHTIKWKLNSKWNKSVDFSNVV